MPLKDREAYNEYMRKYREKKSLEKQMKRYEQDQKREQQQHEVFHNPAKAEQCGKFRRMARNEEKHDTIFMNNHLTECLLCQDWLEDQKRKEKETVQDIPLNVGANIFGSEGNQPDKPKERTDLKSESDFMQDFLDNPDFARKRTVPRIPEDSERREE